MSVRVCADDSSYFRAALWGGYTLRIIGVGFCLVMLWTTIHGSEPKAKSPKAEPIYLNCTERCKNENLKTCDATSKHCDDNMNCVPHRTKSNQLTCSCMEGTVRILKGKYYVCRDINECTKIDCLNECIKRNGGKNCTCDFGYDDIHTLDCLGEKCRKELCQPGRCTNRIAEDFTCGCKAGYTLEGKYKCVKDGKGFQTMVIIGANVVFWPLVVCVVYCLHARRKRWQREKMYLEDAASSSKQSSKTTSKSADSKPRSSKGDDLTKVEDGEAENPSKTSKASKSGDGSRSRSKSGDSSSRDSDP